MRKKATKASRVGRQPAAKRRPTAAQVRACREALAKAVDNYAIAHGEAQWTNGYRASYEARNVVNRTEADRLYRKEMDLWGRVGAFRERVAKARHAYVAAVRGMASR